MRRSVASSISGSMNAWNHRAVEAAVDDFGELPVVVLDAAPGDF